MKKTYSIVLLVLAVALAVAGGVCASALYRERMARARLREVYQGAVLSALRQMEDMGVALNKALLFGDQEAVNRYLSQISVGAAQVQRSLSLLLLSRPAGRNAAKPANQAADYAASLLDRPMVQQDAQQMEARGYWQNHGPRGLLKADIPLEEAEGAVSGRLRVEQARLCLIPPTAGKSCATNSAAATGAARTCAISAPLRAGRSSCCRWWRKIRAWRQFD